MHAALELELNKKKGRVPLNAALYLVKDPNASQTLIMMHNRSQVKEEEKQSDTLIKGWVGDQLETNTLPPKPVVSA